MSIVRSTHASMTSRTRFGGSWPNDESWSLVKQTTSQRPTPRSRRNKDPPGSTVSGTSGTDWANDGNRFSKTTTS
jgi:hypothetical protein